MIDIDGMIQKLNINQQQAVLDESPATLVNANVGSGKTTVLISKIFYQYAQKSIDLKDMVVLTFTNKAANEIRERITMADSQLSDENMPYFGTFHSIAMKMLQTILPVESLGFTDKFTILDPDELIELASRLIIENGFNIKYVNKLSKRIDALRSGKTIYGNMKHEDDINELWNQITKEKINLNKMDFDDLLSNATTLLNTKIYSPKWIIVDEFQDCDKKQLEFIKALMSSDTKVFAVGDPNQIIYSWRGSNQNIFKDFQEKYHAKELSLPINYRSSSTILEAAKCFLSNTEELDGIREQGSNIVVRNHYNPFNEAEYLADKIARLHQEGINYKDIAILYRLQRQSKVLEDVFSKANIPYEVSVRKTLKDIPVLQWLIQLLKASANVNDVNSIISVLSNPSFGEGLSPKEIKEMINGNSNSHSQLLERIVNFNDFGCNTKQANEIYHYYDLDCYLSPTSLTFAENKKYIVDILEKLQEYIDHKDINVFNGIIDFINASTLYGVDVLKEDIHVAADTVKLMTLHACKGLEFKYVFIIGANYGLIPLSTSSESERDEEKRLFFVGITRAKDNLEISYYTSPDDMRVMSGASSYISMIPANLVDGEDLNHGEVDLHSLRREIKENISIQVTSLAVDDRAEETRDCKAIEHKHSKVHHEKYGDGIIEFEDDDIITVHFEAYGSKSFSKAFNSLKYL